MQLHLFSPSPNLSILAEFVKDTQRLIKNACKFVLAIAIALCIQNSAKAQPHMQCLSWPGVAVSEDKNAGAKFAEFIPPDIANAKKNSIPILVTMHGSHGLAEAEIFDWYKYASQKKFAIVAVQWWLKNETYMQPDAVYKSISIRLNELLKKYPALKRNNNLLHGFSRGATYLPAIAYYDKYNNYFNSFLLNSGTYPSDNPPPYMRPILASMNATIYSNKHFFAYYGDKDEFLPTPKIAGWEMKKSIEQRGGKFDLFMTEPEGTHRGLMKNPILVDKVIDAWYQIQ